MEMRVVEWKMEGSLKYRASWKKRDGMREREKETRERGKEGGRSERGGECITQVRK